MLYDLMVFYTVEIGDDRMPISGPYVSIKLTDGTLERYCMGVFRVLTKDEKGRPEECVFLPEDRIVELNKNGGDEFMTAFVPVDLIDK